MSTADLSRPGIWTELFPHALALMDHLAAQSESFTWTFGGGTVLMLRLNHRHSKDVDLFIKDPQYLNYVNPRLSDLAESITSDYDEGAEFIKLYLAPGEIDIVVGASLTHTPFDLVLYEGRRSGSRPVPRSWPRSSTIAVIAQRRETSTTCARLRRSSRRQSRSRFHS